MMVKFTAEMRAGTDKRGNAEMWNRAVNAKTGAEAVAIIAEEKGGDRVYIPSQHYFLKNVEITPTGD
jgi:hypothetical protein